MSIVDDVKDSLGVKEEESKKDDVSEEEKIEEEKPFSKEEESEEDDSDDDSKLESYKKKVSDLNKALAEERAKHKKLPVQDGSKEKEKEPKGADVDIAALVAEEVRKATAGLISEKREDLEKTAIQEFLEKNPGADKEWGDIVAYYKPYFGTDSKENIYKSLEVALSTYQKVSGKTVSSPSFDEGREAGKKEAIVDAAMASQANIPSGSPAGDKSDIALTPSQKEVLSKGGLTKKEYKQFSQGDEFELPIHNK